MDRRKFLAGSVTGALGVSPLAKASAEQSTAATGKCMVTPAVVMAPREDGAEVVWAVNRLCRGRVECRPAGGGESRVFRMDDFGMVPQGAAILRVRLEGLKPGTAYEVRAITEPVDGSGREDTPWKSFRTLAPAAASTRFVVWNDTHEHHDTIRKLDDVTPDADFLIWNGDTCNDWHQEEWLVPTLLHPAGRDFSEGHPLMLVWGNHDVRGKWAFKVKDMMAAPHGRPFYAFRSGPVAVICLHTGEDKPDDHPSFGGRVAFDPLRREQAEWLEETIASPGIRDAPYRVVFCHIPLRWRKEPVFDYAKGGYDWYSKRSRDAWHDALVKWGAQVIISGHTHSDEWLPANGTFPYAQMVSGGPKMPDARWIEGSADAGSLKLVMRDLDGRVVREAEFQPV